MALDELKMPTIMLWPNADAGSEDVARGMRKFREKYPTVRYERLTTRSTA